MLNKKLLNVKKIKMRCNIIQLAISESQKQERLLNEMIVCQFRVDMACDNIQARQFRING